MKMLNIITLIFILMSCSSASDFTYTNKEIKLENLLSGKHKNKILYFDFDNNSKLLSVSNNAVKIWDIQNSELISNVDKKNNYIKAKFSHSKNIVYILSKDYFSVYDILNSKNIVQINKNHLRDFVLSSNEKKLFLLTHNKLYLYDLTTKSVLYTIKTYSKNITISQNNKYIAISNSKKIDIYKADNGILINSIKTDKTLTKVFFTNNNEFYCIYENKQLILYNFKTSKELYKNTFNDYVKSYSFIKNTKVALLKLANSNSLNLVNLETKKIEKIITYNLNNISKNGIKLSDDNSLLAIGTNDGNIKLFNRLHLFDKHSNVKSSLDKPKIKKAVKVSDKQKFSLRIIASRIEGIVPFKVVFTIISSDIKNIDSYYINLAGHETMKQGKPPMTLEKVFNTAGTFKVFVAIKSTSGEIFDEEIIINAKEETFSDFKQIYK